MKGLNRFLKLAIDWEANIPDDAIRLVKARTLQEPTPQFSARVNELEQSVLKGLMCQAARRGLDAAGESQAEQATPDYVEVGVETYQVQYYLEVNLTAFSEVSEALDITGVAEDSILEANAYIKGINDIIESPDGGIAAANVVYFRNCVLRQ
ncbi:hypothetical protein CW368_00170 [Actinomycetales bacterium SN12]|nr:hypothetical protein CW368_00170 [Actinomycetales bacterium SN12]